MQNMQVCERQFTQKKAWKLRQLGHLSNPFRLSYLCFTFFPTLKNFHKKKGTEKKKGRHNHTSSMLWDKTCGTKI